MSDTVGDVTNPTLSPVAAYGYIGYRVLERTYKNGTRLTYLNPSSGLDDGYDGLRRVVIQRHVDSSNAIVAQFSHTYNRTNNRLNEIREHHLDGGLRVGEQYTYDSLYRLTNFQVGTFTAGGIFNTPSGSQQWQLDGVGNWSIWGHDYIVSPQAINSVNEYTSFAGTANAFDANKNLTDDGNFLYAFDFLNRLREVRRKSDNALIATYLYDSNGSAHLMGAGRRIRKATTVDSTIGATTIIYVYDSIITIEESDGSDALLRQYVNGQRIDEHLSMDTYTSGAISATYYYHENALGNVIALTDGTGAVVERYTYEAYGKPEFRDASNVQQSIVQSAVANPFLFNGQRYDPETGLSYYRHRYLNHEQGRFLNRDPVGTTYSFMLGNPLMGIDPSGLKVKLIDKKRVAGGPIEADANRVIEALNTVLGNCGEVKYKEVLNFKEDQREFQLEFQCAIKKQSPVSLFDCCCMCSIMENLLAQDTVIMFNDLGPSGSGIYNTESDSITVDPNYARKQVPLTTNTEQGMVAPSLGRILLHEMVHGARHDRIVVVPTECQDIEWAVTMSEIYKSMDNTMTVSQREEESHAISTSNWFYRGSRMRQISLR